MASVADSEFQQLPEFIQEGNRPLLARLDPPAEFRLVPHMSYAGIKVDIFDQKVNKLTGPHTGQQ